MKFSIIVVCLNAGEELHKTVKSILDQSYEDFEVIVKDGLSEDGSVEQLPEDGRIRVFREKDRGIYDAMNQAVRYISGDYVLFLNCGDYFYDRLVLSHAAKEIAGYQADILYGDLYRRIQDSTDIAPERLTEFVCYRNVPCHQVCFYRSSLFAERAYDLHYPVRADYEHFLYCFYRKKAKCRHMKRTVASYAGEGFSETGGRAEAGRREHKKITAQYMGWHSHLYHLLMLLSLQPLRKKLADSPATSAFYHKLKGWLYGGRK